MRQTRNIQRAAIAATIGLAVSFAPPAIAATGTSSGALRSAVSAENIMNHLEALQEIADANGGNRAADSPGYAAWLDYIYDTLHAAGYKPVRQPFSYDRYDFTSASLERVSPNPETYTHGTDFLDMSYSGAGDVTADLTAVDLDLAGDRASTSGCEAADFAGFRRETSPSSSAAPAPSGSRRQRRSGRRLAASSSSTRATSSRGMTDSVCSAAHWTAAGSNPRREHQLRHGSRTRRAQRR